MLYQAYNLRLLCLIAALPITSPSLAEERTEVIGTLVPLGDGIEFALTEYGGCRTAHKNHPVLHGAVFRSGMNDIPYVPGCWERLANGDFRVYIDQWKPAYQVTTIPAKKAVTRIITAPVRPPRPILDPRVS